jgi:hypothetical protein
MKEITRQSGETTKLMTTQNSTLSEQMSQMMKLIQGTLSEGQQHQNSPVRKQQRLNNDGTPMDEERTVPPFPSTTEKRLQLAPTAYRNGTAARAGENK